MFISPVADQWFFTTQLDHSGLVGQVAAFWGNADFTPPNPVRSMVVAAAEHDHNWVGEDHHGLLRPDGRPFDFANLPYDRHTGLYAVGARQIADRDPYAGLMVSLHGMGIYNYRHGTDQSMLRPRRSPEDAEIIDGYIAGEAAFQEELRATMPESHRPFLADEILWTNYHILQVWDRLGILMSKYVQEDFVIEPAPTDYAGGKASLKFTFEDTCRFRIDPYPFAVPEVSFPFVARFLDQIEFDDDADYQRVLDLAPRTAVTYTFHA